MTRKRKAILLVIPVLVLVLVLAISSVGLAAAGGNGKGNGNGNGKAVVTAPSTDSTVVGEKTNNGKGVIHTIYTAADGTVYNAIYHVNNGKLTVTGAVYPKSGPLK